MNRITYHHRPGAEDHAINIHRDDRYIGVLRRMAGLYDVAFADDALGRTGAKRRPADAIAAAGKMLGFNMPKPPRFA